MAQLATGVTVLTVAGTRAHGMTANAFTSVSLDPPLVMCCVGRTARMHAAIGSTRCFAVSILSGEQEHLARYFSDKRRANGMAQFDSVSWTPGPCTGAPLLNGALAWLECEVIEAYDGGDHSIFLGGVLSATRGPGPSGLTFFRGAFQRVGQSAVGDRPVSSS
ncbi:flavin reductase family protein [Amycolatopsis anabasis]|uniref:flavin reductase family protein n=1 Tax=Amycolatopsis anabasis TaxID=1840409 RepID=UPI00131CD0E8|nr:flavin reductase family protein [Amycolatopsis anabasis]